MKTTILTSILALVALVGMGQSKTKPDTIPVTFQEVIVHANGRDTILLKQWTDGYNVHYSEPIYIDGKLCRCFHIESYYLYADRKTRVTNQVLKDINRN